MEILLTYKGFVCLDNEDDFVLVINDEFGFKYVPIDDKNDNYKHLTPDSVCICGVKFFEGTEPVTIEYCNDVQFKDIFIQIQDFGDIKSDDGSSIFEKISYDYDETNGLWEVIEDVFKNPVVEVNYMNFINEESNT